MRVLLVQPNYDAHIIHPPLGLGYLAAYLKENYHEVAIFDATLKNASLEQILLAIKDFSPGLVGITVLSRGHNKVKKVVSGIKKLFPGLPVVIGGTQVTAAPAEVLVDIAADFAVVGEGENTLSELVEMIESGKDDYSRIDGLAFKNNEAPRAKARGIFSACFGRAVTANAGSRCGGKIRRSRSFSHSSRRFGGSSAKADKNEVIVTKRRELIINLDSLPFPAWDLMPPDKYRIVPILEPAKAFPVAPVLTSRGCPYNCSFCASNVTWERKIRFRSPENVVREIKKLKEDFGVREIHFADDNFTMDIERAEKICDLMIKKKINLPWQCPNGVRIDRLSTSLLEKMKQSGCYALGLGIESGNQKILDRNNKKLDLAIVPGVLKNLKEIGIESYGFFILGLPGDTRETIRETVDFALKNDFDRVWFNLFTPYLGSPAFDSWLGSRHLPDIDWDKHDCSTAVVKIKGIGSKELERLQKVALRRFYLRPKNLVKLLIRLRSREILTLVMSRFFGKIGKPLFIVAHKLTPR